MNMYRNPRIIWRSSCILICLILFSSCGTVRLEVPKGQDVRLLMNAESSEVRVERTVWFWLWGAKPISDNSIKSEVEKHNLKEVRAYTTQTMTDNIVTLVTSLVSITRRTLVIEGNTTRALPANNPVSNMTEQGT
jgi:hypothetical protein